MARVTYGTNASLLSDLFLFINIDLVKLNPGSLSRKLFKDRRDGSRRTTFCPKVDGDNSTRVDLSR